MKGGSSSMDALFALRSALSAALSASASPAASTHLCGTAPAWPCMLDPTGTVGYSVWDFPLRKMWHFFCSLSAHCDWDCHCHCDWCELKAELHLHRCCWLAAKAESMELLSLYRWHSGLQGGRRPPRSGGAPPAAAACRRAPSSNTRSVLRAALPQQQMPWPGHVCWLAYLLQIDVSVTKVSTSFMYPQTTKT